MGRKGNWFSAMKKALNPDAKEKSSQEPGKSKKKWFRKKKRSDANSAPLETGPTTASTLPPQQVPPSASTPSEPAKLSTSDQKEQTKHAYAVALATAKAAEAAVAAAQAAAEVVRLTATETQFPGKSKEEVAAIKIQTAFRGYMARRALRALRGIMRLKTVMQGQAVKRQTTNTLKSMQTLARVQAQVRERRLRMAEENQARQRLLHQNHAKEQAKDLDKSQHNGDGWDSTGKTKEQIEAKMQSKHEAAIRRERTMAYAFTHQQPWKASARSASTLFMDSNNPHWGWSWLERWLAARPWETAERDQLSNSDISSPRIVIPTIGKREITKKPSPKHVTGGRLSTSNVPSKGGARKLRAPSPKARPRLSVWGPDDDNMSDDSRRNSSAAGSSVRDDEVSVASSKTVPSYMAPTESAKAKSSRLGASSGEFKMNSKSVTPDRVSVSSAKKRLSYPPSPARSRHSTSSAAEATSVSEHT